MNSIKNIIVVLLCFISTFVMANNLQITNVQDQGSNKISFDISWENAWRVGTDYHDAVWVFVKYRSANTSQWLHADITGISTVGGNLEEMTQADEKGIFIRLNTDYRGNIAATNVVVQLSNIQGVFPDFKVFGVEMVYVPQGAFYVGDGAGGSSYRYYPDGDTSLAYQITSEGAITDMKYLSPLGASIYNTSNISTDFPKGYDAFYCMKYEITNSQYVDFLNTLPRTAQDNNTASDLSTATIASQYVMIGQNTPLFRSSIKCDANQPLGQTITFYCDLNNNNTPNESDDGQNIACLFSKPTDLLSYLDWSGLRPMSSFEFEKAARGTVAPNPREFVWGSTVYNTVSSITNAGTDAETAQNIGTDYLVNFSIDLMRVGFAANNTSTRTSSGASFYGIMNLGDNNSEIAIAAESHNTGSGLATTFIGSLGDGQLNNQGSYTNTDWTQNNNNEVNIHGTIFLGGSGTPILQSYILSNWSANISVSTTSQLLLGGRGVR